MNTSFTRRQNVKKYITHSAQQTIQLGEKLAKNMPAKTLLVFNADMGMGKTTLCRGIAKGLGCTDEVSSPTFSIVHLYQGQTPFAHFDMDRVASLDDLETAGFFDYLSSNTFVAVEWGENIQEWLPKPYTLISIQPINEESRTFILQEVE